MKSAAFNLAFKVHRNEIPFAEGLLKAVEVEAQEDYLEALNSLAGESKYDVMQMDALIVQARKSVVQDVPPRVDTSAIQKEIQSLSKKRAEYEESIQTLETQRAALKVTILPGINSALLGLVGVMIAVVVWLMGYGLGVLLAIGITLVISGLMLVQDLHELKKQRERVEQRKHKFLSDIATLHEIIDAVDQDLHALHEQLDAGTALGPSTSSFNPTPDTFLMP
ncbi:MAG: hypothetical protein RBU29_13625 [bacterium]|jgi:cell division protein FtsB|nr:hypothetical protein [bacterium]